jgi:hypothetical protein
MALAYPFLSFCGEARGLLSSSHAEIRVVGNINDQYGIT